MTNTEKNIREYYELNQMKAELESRMEELKSLILEDMATEETDTMMAGNIKAMSKTVKASRFDSKAFKADHADMYESYTKHTFSTRFTVNAIKTK